MEKKIILASGSPRRREILGKRGINPEIMKTDIDESLPSGISFRDAVMFLSLKKGLEAEGELLNPLQKEGSTEESCGDNDGDDYLIISADTVVYKEGILGKPKDEDDAFRMLSSLRGESHFVATGVTLLSKDRLFRRTLCDVTKVYCKDYTDDEIREYIATGEPFDKAGSYAIQGIFGKYIDHIEGDFENVVGLPFYTIKPYLEEYLGKEIPEM